MDGHLGVSSGAVSRIEVIAGRSGRRVRCPAERARIAAESFLPGVRVADVARKHGTTRWQVYDWRKRLRDGRLAYPWRALLLKGQDLNLRPSGYEPAGPERPPHLWQNCSFAISAGSLSSGQFELQTANGSLIAAMSRASGHYAHRGHGSLRSRRAVRSASRWRSGPAVSECGLLDQRSGDRVRTVGSRSADLRPGGHRTPPCYGGNSEFSHWSPWSIGTRCHAARSRAGLPPACEPSRRSPS